MYPPQLSKRTLNSPKLRAEIETFEALSKLPDDFEVFYNRCPTNGLAARAFERKIDFIILHAQLGFLAIEVKGGKIRIGSDGGFEQYYNNCWNSIDPIQQAKIAFYELVNTIKSDGGNYWIPDGYCVFFPHTARLDLTTVPHQLPSGTLCSDELPILATMIPSFFQKPQSGKSAWKKREDYIDVRRRLQTMPESQNHIDAPPAAKVSQKTVSYKNINHRTNKYQDYQTKTLRNPTVHHATAFDVKPPKEWHVLISVAWLIAAILIISWFIPSSPIKIMLREAFDSITHIKFR
jgi:hypothetical protein